MFVVFGGLTIYFHNEDFIKWKPTIVYCRVCVGMLLIPPPVQEEPDARGDVKSDQAARRGLGASLNMAWICFFVVMG
jgi:intracellular septation protein